MRISIIVAMGLNNAIGKNNALLWHLPNDLKMFKSLTSGHAILMGRKTYESIGRPLPNRNNIVISTNIDLKIEGCTVFSSVSDALSALRSTEATEIFIIGGGQIYNETFHFVDRMYLTKVNENFEGDVFFPEINFEKWNMISSSHFDKDEKHAFDFDFEIWDRK